MAKIKIHEPDGPFGAVIDTKVAEVTIEEAYLGVGFVTAGGEKLAVCMRENGYEIRYSADGHDSGWISLKNGTIDMLSNTVSVADIL